MRRYIALAAVVLISLFQTTSCILGPRPGAGISISEVVTEKMSSSEILVSANVKGTEEITEVQLVYCLKGDLTVDELEKPSLWTTKKRTVEPMKLVSGTSYQGKISSVVVSEGEVCYFIEVKDAIGTRAFSKIYTVN